MSEPFPLPEVREHIAARTFNAPCSSDARIGVEVEYHALDATTQAVAPLMSRLVPALEPLAASNGWLQQHSAKGAPRFVLPDGGAIAFEPGGQLEYASPPARTPAALLAGLRDVLPAVEEAAQAAGITLLPAGIDPYNGPEAAPLQMCAERYLRMQEYFDAIGPAGMRMMRQTASLQISVDPIGDRLTTWRMLNALAPYLTAMFANSPRYAGTETGCVSYRARTWQLLDPARTGLLGLAADAVGEYTDFALDAPVMLVRSQAGGYVTLREWVACTSVSHDFVDTHLSTLFPEVRPRGHFEIRSVDALPSAWLAAPVLFVAGLLRDPASLAAAIDALGRPDPSALARAAVSGLRDAALARTACELADLAVTGCRRLGDEVAGEDFEVLCAFLDTYTRRARSPADDATFSSVATAA